MQGRTQSTFYTFSSCGRLAPKGVGKATLSHLLEANTPSSSLPSIYTTFSIVCVLVPLHMIVAETWLQRVLYRITWIYVSGLIVKLNMALGVCGRSCSRHDRQEADTGKKRVGIIHLQGPPPNDLLPLASPTFQNF